MPELCTDILYDVFVDIWGSHRPSLLNASLVCKSWNRIAQRILNGRLDKLIIGPHTEERNKAIFDRVESDREFQNGLHTITVQDVFSSGMVQMEKVVPELVQYNHGRQQGAYGYLEQKNEATMNQIDHLARVISKAPALRNFIWEAKSRLPDVILNALHESPNCRVQLHLREDNYGSQSGSFIFPSIETPDSIKSILPFAPRMTQLGVILPASKSSPTNDDKPEIDMFDILGKVVSRAPLHSFSLHAAGTLYVSDDFHTVKDTNWLSNNLDGLRLRVNSLRLTNVCLCAATIKTKTSFQSSIHWPTLKSIHLTCPTILNLIPSTECQLRSLTLDLDPTYKDLNHSCTLPPNHALIRTFILSQTHLRHLSISHGLRVFETTSETSDTTFLQHLGHTLTSLTISEIEAPYPSPQKRLSLLPQTLVTLGAVSPYLRTLAIPLPDEDAAGVFYANCIKKHLVQLHHLTLTLSLEGPGQYPGRTPVSLQRSVDMWTHLLTPSTGLSLRSLLIAVGSKCAGERLGKHVWDPMRDHQRRFIIKKPQLHEIYPDLPHGFVWANCIEIDEFLAAGKWGDRTTYAGFSSAYLGILQGLVAEGLCTRGFGEDD